MNLRSVPPDATKPMMAITQGIQSYLKIGEGVHSEVFRRAGSRFVVQLFRSDCPELTVGKLRREYAYLRAVYATMPKLIPWQRLVQPRAEASLQESVLIKHYIPHRRELALHRVDPAKLRPATLDQIKEFLRITRELLISTRPHAASEGGDSMMPDIIDPDWANLVVNVRTGDLVLIDTNRLISTRKIMAAGWPTNVERRPIHALLFRRLMYLESKYLDRSRTALVRDPVYSRYLDADGFDALFAASASVGEDID